jgi:hypothetical protein
MRNIIIGLLLLLSFGASAQWQQTGSKVRYVNGLGIPTKDTAAGVAADSSQILIRPADSSLYIKYKRTWVKVGSGGTIGGSGTINRVAKFTASTTLGNSQITDNGTSVGINQTSPIYQLHVTSGGSAIVFTDAGTSAVIAGTNPNATVSALLSLRGDTVTITGGGINGAEHLRINGSGNVGINNTTPNEKLSIVQPALTSYPTLGSASGGISLLGDSKLYGLYTGINTVDGNAWMQVMRNNTATAYNLLLQPVGGNVGIGTTSPSQLLTINGQTRILAGGALALNRPDNGAASTISTDASNNLILTGAARISLTGTTLINTTTDNGVDKLQVSGGMNVSAKATVQNLSVTGTTSTTGNIGIFNSSPIYAVHVGDGTSTRQVVINGLNSGSAGGSSIAVQTNSLTTMMFGNKSNIIGGAYDGQPVFGFGGNTNSLQFYNFNTTVTSAMISSGDRFLIGTTSDNTVDRLQVNGSISGIGFKQAYVAKTGAYTATNDDYVIDCTSGTFTVTLPASSGRTGRILIIKNSGAGTITVDGNASETIDGATTVTLAVQYGTIQIMSDGANWKIISKF